ncbi:uncharacterized protein LOC134349881 [Mobula hypostoma]|uniref:uncharacterized protein LOC134349881 n=1 Tax=Mobula hypostoma TaxID=723540 RepID=UPI002FC3DB3F
MGRKEVRCKFHPRKSPARRHAPVSSLYLLDYDRRIAELGLEHEPPVMQISGQRFSFRKGRWVPQLQGGFCHSSQGELLRGIREKNKVLQEQNNMLQLRLELTMDMLTEATANLIMLEDKEENTEEEQVNKEEGEEEEEEVEIKKEEELVEKKEKKVSLKKIPHQYELDLNSEDLETAELLYPTLTTDRYLEDEDDLSAEVSSKFATKRRQGETKPKVCPMRRASQARAKLRASLYSLPPVGPVVPKSPKTKSSPKVCKLELEPEPQPRTPRQRRPRARPRLVEESNGTCPLKRRSRI